MIDAIFLVVAICLGCLGGFVGMIATVVFIVQKRKRLAVVSAVLFMVLFGSGLFCAVILVYKSCAQVKRSIVEELSCDVGSLDATGNLKGFERHFKMLPGEQVSSIYYYADELGADCRYQLSFKCDPATIENIIAVLGLVRSEEFHGLAPNEKLFWWPLGATEGRDFWMRESAGQYSRELWYSESDHMAYYQEYSL